MENLHVFLLLHRLLPLLSKEDNHLEEIVANLSDVSLVYDQPQYLRVMPSEMSWKSGDVFALLDAISSGMTLSHER
jgi:hypothetical protein